MDTVRPVGSASHIRGGTRRAPVKTDLSQAVTVSQDVVVARHDDQNERHPGDQRGGGITPEELALLAEAAEQARAIALQTAPDAPGRLTQAYGARRSEPVIGSDQGHFDREI